MKVWRAFFWVKITKIDKSQISNISRIPGIMETSISNISRIVDNQQINFPIFPGYEQIDIVRFPIFPGFWSANLIFGINFAIRFRLEINLIMTPRNYYNYPRLSDCGVFTLLPSQECPELALDVPICLTLLRSSRLVRESSKTTPCNKYLQRENHSSGYSDQSSY